MNNNLIFKLVQNLNKDFKIKSIKINLIDIFLFLYAGSLFYLAFIIEGFFLGILEVIFIVMASIRLGVKGGIIATLWSAGILIMNSFLITPHPSELRITSGIILYLIIGIGLGKVINITRNQRKKLKQLNLKLHEKEKFTASILNNQSALVVVLDTKGRIIRFNKACEKITNYSASEVKGRLIWDILIPLKEQQEVKKIIQQVNDLPNKHKNHWKTKDDELYLISWSSRAITNEQGTIQYIVATGVDITKQQKQAEKINHMHFHDQLTDLYNRDYLEEEMKRLDTARQLPISIIIGDVNGLKLINDTYGHQIGDKMLVKIATILKKSCRSEDIIARWGGDEFVILLPQTKLKEAKSICDRINQACKNCEIEQIPLSIALGAATKKEDQEDLTAIFNQAEEKMYQNKLLESKKRKNKILKNLLTILNEKTPERKEHIKNVQKISLALGKELDLTSFELHRLSLLAVVHDIGKVAISEKILTKSNSLTTQEREKINKHPKKGYQIISSIKDLAPIADQILYHHENWDGSGYPMGLKKEQIPLLARIINIAISYDAMINGRSYKNAITQEETITELKKYSGTQFDPKLVEILIKLIKNDNLNDPKHQFLKNNSIINKFLN